MKIKVCGLKDADNIRDLSSLGVDYMGFIFYSRSPRFCGNVISPFLLDRLPSGVEPVAVTVNMGEADIMGLSSRYGFRTFQLHGEESPELCGALRKAGLCVIKAIGVESREDMEKAAAYTGKVDFFLFDSSSPQKGGSGRKFEWSALEAYNLDEPFFLSGGIGPEDVDAIKAHSHSKLSGVDLNSRFESAPGVKDVDMVKCFLEALS